MITSEADYEKALERLEELVDKDPEPGTNEHVYLLLLSQQISEYEDKHYPKEEVKR